MRFPLPTGREFERRDLRPPNSNRPRPVLINDGGWCRRRDRVGPRSASASAPTVETAHRHSAAEREDDHVGTTPPGPALRRSRDPQESGTDRDGHRLARAGHRGEHRHLHAHRRRRRARAAGAGARRTGVGRRCVTAHRAVGRRAAAGRAVESAVRTAARSESRLHGTAGVRTIRHGSR